MKPHLLGQGVYSFVDGSLSCPPKYVPFTDMALSNLNPSYLSWKQQDQLIMSVILSSLSTEVLHLVVDCQTSHGLWRALETTLASPSNSLIIQLHGSFQDLRQNDSTVSVYLQQSKTLFNELAIVGMPLSLKDFNTLIFIVIFSHMSFCIRLLFNPSWQLHYYQHHLSLLQISSHNISHNRQVTIITKILVIGVIFMEDERIITVAISIMEIIGITLVRMLTIMTLVLDSLLDKILGNTKIALGVVVSGLILGKQNVSSTISLGIQHNNAPKLSTYNMQANANLVCNTQSESTLITWFFLYRC